MYNYALRAGRTIMFVETVGPLEVESVVRVFHRSGVLIDHFAVREPVEVGSERVWGTDGCFPAEDYDGAFRVDSWDGRSPAANGGLPAAFLLAYAKADARQLVQ